MPYTPTVWVDDSVPAISAANLNHIEAGIAAATTFTEQWETLTIPSNGSWQNVALSGYGVAAGDVCEVVLTTDKGGPLACGVREDGSALVRLLYIHSGPVSLTVTALGATAIIEVYRENADVTVRLAGYWG